MENPLFAFIHTEDEKRQAAEARARQLAAVSDRRTDVAEAGNRRTYQAMLDSVKDWQLPELPELSRFDEVIIDLETTGLRWWDDDRMIGAAIWTPDGQRRYLPIRHKLGPNHAPEKFFDWCRHELRGKRVVNIRTKFDLHMFRADGINLEDQGCTFGDVAHYAALLDDHRTRFNQEALVQAFLGSDAGKVRRVGAFELDPTKFAEYPAGLVAARAEDDVLQVSLLQAAMWPRLEAEGLHTVRALEDSVIPVVVEMEHNGAPLDVEKLERWCFESARDLDYIRLAIKKATGISFEKFTNRDAAVRLFHHLHIPVTLDPDEPYTEGGKPRFSFADAVLKPIKHPLIRAYRAGLQLESLRSKFLLKYQRSVARDGILRYELHQLPYQDDSEGTGGAVSGRFSSAAPSRDEGANIQQVFGVDIQKKFRSFTKKYLVKELFIPGDPKAQYVNADASQLQFRIFGHYADDEKLERAYDHDRNWREIDALAVKLKAEGVPKKKWPKEALLTDFHDVVGEIILKFAHKVLIRTHVKNVNFAQVFGAGIPKMATQLEVPADQIPSREEWAEASKNRTTHLVGGPLFQEVVALSATYHEMFPSVKPLLAMAAHLAMPHHREGSQREGQNFDARGCSKACREFERNGIHHRGFVRTFLGRRARFNFDGKHSRFYSALNRVIQGTEADDIKLTLVEVHKQRKRLGLVERFTVHDAVAGDLHGDPRALKEVLNTQVLDFKVPILWDVAVGKNWAEAK